MCVRMLLSHDRAQRALCTSSSSAYDCSAIRRASRPVLPLSSAAPKPKPQAKAAAGPPKASLFGSDSEEEEGVPRRWGTQWRCPSGAMRGCVALSLCTGGDCAPEYL